MICHQALRDRPGILSMARLKPYPRCMPRFAPGQTLLIDADDTLWENNIYFERAIAAFIGFLDHREYTPAEVRQMLNCIERENILAHGYGLSSFTQSLVKCFERLSPAPVTDEKRERIRGFARAIAEQEIELLPGVDRTLAELGGRHRLILMTKGNEAEQADKLARSGKAFFRRRDCGGEKPSGISRGNCAPRSCAGEKLDDRQQPQKRYQSRARRRPERGFSVPQGYLGSGACQPRSGSRWAASAGARLLRPAMRLLLIPAGLPSADSASAPGPEHARGNERQAERQPKEATVI